jgi:hypothetical protein
MRLRSAVTGQAFGSSTSGGFLPWWTLAGAASSWAMRRESASSARRAF